MKNKIVFKSQKDFVKWVTVSNMFAKSRIMPMVALKQFNSLKANQRTNIKKAFEEYDQKRRIKIPKGEIDSAWTISVMVDAHIIATEYNAVSYTHLAQIHHSYPVEDVRHETTSLNHHRNGGEAHEEVLFQFRR